MMRSAQLLGLTIVLSMAIAVPGISFAQEAPAVTQVYIMGVNDNLDAFLAEAKNNEKIFARLGINAKRTYRQATLAGALTGQIALTIDYANLESLAVAQEKLANDAEWQKYIDKLGTAGITAESSAVWMDITP
jgi:hypothetical protein